MTNGNRILATNINCVFYYTYTYIYMETYIPRKKKISKNVKRKGDELLKGK